MSFLSRIASIVALSAGLLTGQIQLALAQQNARPDTEGLEVQARHIVQQFVAELKPALKRAMNEGGPTEAIAVCSDKAPAIAANLSEENGWNVKRVSLKPRNRQTATPDAWERDQLRAFDRREAAGESPAQINAFEQVGEHFRYMQAQGVEPLCLACHGENLAPEVKRTLQQFYPDDAATGYQLGQIRGAISLQRELRQ